MIWHVHNENFILNSTIIFYGSLSFTSLWRKSYFLRMYPNFWPSSSFDDRFNLWLKKKKRIYLGYCKVVIYNYIFVGFNSMSNLIVFLFNHFLVFLWDLMERLSVRVCWRFVKKVNLWLACEWTTRERPCDQKHMLEFEQSHVKLDFASYFATQTKSRVTCETHYLNFLMCVFLISLL